MPGCGGQNEVGFTVWEVNDDVEGFACFGRRINRWIGRDSRDRLRPWFRSGAKY
jgi:hypothetical protein